MSMRYIVSAAGYLKQNSAKLALVDWKVLPAQTHTDF